MNTTKTPTNADKVKKNTVPSTIKTDRTRDTKQRTTTKTPDKRQTNSGISYAERAKLELEAKRAQVRYKFD